MERMNLFTRIRRLERAHNPGPVYGWLMTLRNPAGDVLDQVVMVSGTRPGMATRWYDSPAAFEAAHPDGVLRARLILEHAGPPPPSRSFEGQWFGREAPP